MKTKKNLTLLAMFLGLSLFASGISDVMAECTDQSGFNVKGYCLSDNNDGYYIKAGVGIPIARIGFQCKFLQVSNADMNKVIFIPLASGTTGDEEYTSLLNAVSTSSSITSFVSVVDCSATCDTNNNLIVTVGSSIFTYPCGEYAECINDISGNGACTRLTCDDTTPATAGYYNIGSDMTPLLWCPHFPLTRTDKANGLTVPTTSNDECPLAPVADEPCAFSTCGNGQVNGTEICDIGIDVSGRCRGCQCGNFEPERISGALTGRCLTSCVIAPVCSTDTPFTVDCGCSLCPGDEKLMWPENTECQLYNTRTSIYNATPTAGGTFFGLPKICKSCGTAQSNGTYKPMIKLRMHGFYRFNYSANTPYDRTISTTCTDLTPGTPKNISCRKVINSGSILDLQNNSGVDCPAGTSNDTTVNEVKRGILSCNQCPGTINGQYSNGLPFYYDGACHPCEKGLAATNYGNATWNYCRDRYGIADLNNDGDLNDPGENLTQYRNNTGSDPEAPYYRRNSVSTVTGCDNDNNGLLDSDKAFHRWYTQNTCVPYTFCTDDVTSTVYPNCVKITDAPTLDALQAQKPVCPADQLTPAPTTEGTPTVCTPCPAPYKHVNAYIRLTLEDNSTLNLDYRTRVSNSLVSKYTCHDKCDRTAPFYYDKGAGSGPSCYPCPPDYTLVSSTWNSSYLSQYITCTKIPCPNTALIYDDTNDGINNPICHECPRNTYNIGVVTNWPLSGSKCWPTRAYCNNTTYPGTSTKYPTGIFFRRVTNNSLIYNSPDGEGGLYLLGNSDNSLPPFITDNSIYTTDPAVCSCPAGTRYQDNEGYGGVPDRSYFYTTSFNLQRPTVYCSQCPAGSEWLYQGEGETAPSCHECPRRFFYIPQGATTASCQPCALAYYYQGEGETVYSCHTCSQAYFYIGTGETAASCHSCTIDYFYQAPGETAASCHSCTLPYYYKAVGESSPSCHSHTCTAEYVYQAPGEAVADCHNCTQDYFFQYGGEAAPSCHSCTQGYYFQYPGEASASCHSCTLDYFYQSIGETSARCHSCLQVVGCDNILNCSLPQYSCNVNGDPLFDPEVWEHMPDCSCRCTLTAASCTGLTPYLNPILCRCQSTSLSAYCGNGTLDPGEECDLLEDGDSYLDTNGVAHINRCTACKIHRVTACDSRAYITWISGSYTERPVAGQCPSGLTSATNNKAGLSAYTCGYWEPKYIDTVMDPNPVHQSEAAANSACVFTCSTGYNYDPVSKMCGI